MARLLVLLYLDDEVSVSDGRANVLEGGSYLDLVVGDEASSLELRRESVIALSRKAPARVEAVETDSMGLDLTAGVVGFASDSSVSLSSSELSSSDDDSSFFTAALAAGVWFRNRL